MPPNFIFFRSVDIVPSMATSPWICVKTNISFSFLFLRNPCSTDVLHGISFFLFKQQWAHRSYFLVLVGFLPLTLFLMSYCQFRPQQCAYEIKIPALFLCGCLTFFLECFLEHFFLSV